MCCAAPTNLIDIKPSPCAQQGLFYFLGQEEAVDNQRCERASASGVYRRNTRTAIQILAATGRVQPNRFMPTISNFFVTRSIRRISSSGPEPCFGGHWCLNYKLLRAAVISGRGHAVAWSLRRLFFHLRCSRLPVAVYGLDAFGKCLDAGVPEHHHPSLVTGCAQGVREPISRN